MLSHKNLLSNIEAIYRIPPQDPQMVTLSFLPLCHVLERIMNYMYQYNGYTIYYVDNIALVSDAMRETNPHIVCCVPRVLESIHDKIMATGRKLSGYERFFFFWAIRIGYKYKIEGNNVFYRAQLWLLRKLVFKNGNRHRWQFRYNCKWWRCTSGKTFKNFWAAGFHAWKGMAQLKPAPLLP